jgi:GNAT superfamily N-acetyltransferase
MGQLWLQLRRARLADLGAVTGLLAEASRWLRTKHTDQWAEPWPSEDVRRQRIREAIQAGRTWIAWDSDRPAATITASPNDHHIWPEENRREPAVYIRRLAVSRRYAGQGLGAQFLDWAGLRASRQYGAQWVRVDVWTTNTELHEYYRRQGFEFCGFCETIEGYPSAALFQKPVYEIKPLEDPLFWESSETQ